MIEVRHRQNILDIHPLVIYLMLSDSEYDRYSKNIKRINKYLGTTLGVFEYKCLRRSNADYSELPERFGNALRYSNVMVKLLGKQNNSNRYALDYIDLNTDGNSVLDAIRNFALNVCGEDIKLLEESLGNKTARHTDEDRRGIDRIIAILEQALNTKAGRRPKWKDHTAIEVCTARNESTCIPRSHDIFSSNVPSFGFISRNIGRQMPLEDDDAELCDDLPGADLFGDIRRILKSHNIESDETPEVAKEIYELVKARWDIDKEQSDKNAQAIVEGKPSEPPVISIELIPTTVYGRQREKYGVRITLGDSNIPVIFSHTDQMLLYITSLIRFKADCPLCLRELYRPVVGPLCATERYRHLRRWFVDLFNTIIDKDGWDAEAWLRKVGNLEKEGRVLYQAKSNINTALSKAISNYAIFKHCELIGNKDRGDHTTYIVDIPRENIRVDERLQKFIDRFIDLAALL